MATYKAEFTHHHYAGRPWARPLSHWSMGWLPQLSRIASKAPRLVNRMAGTPAGETTRRDRAGAGYPRLRRADVHFVVPRPHASARYARRSHAVAGQLHQLPCAASGSRRCRGTGSRRVRSHAAGRPGVLRPDMDLHRPVAGGQAAHHAFVGGPGAASGLPHSDRRTGAELHRCAAAGRSRASARQRAGRRTGRIDVSRSPNSSPAQAGNHPTSRRMRSCRRIVTSTPCSALTRIVP